MGVFNAAGLGGHIPGDSEISDSAPLQDTCWSREVVFEVFGDSARYQDGHSTGLVWGDTFPIPRGSALSVAGLSLEATVFVSC